MKEYKVKSIEETFEIAKTIAENISFPAIILLRGDLGAGKTHFVKGFAQALGCDELVTSPTFTIMNEYLGGKCPIYHFDMYRLHDDEEARMLGFEEYFHISSLQGVSIVEWPENVEGLFQDEYISVDIFKGDKENERLIKVRGLSC